MELEVLLGERCFLDSDDLRSLDRLVDHVKGSKSLVIVQTKSVLTRPYCLLELLTAIDAGIPIVGVKVGGNGAAAYSYADAANLLTWLDEELETLNPGAPDVLRDHGIDDLTTAAYKLANTVPKAIAVPLDVGGSRKVLRATIEDLAETIGSAVLPPLPLKAKWLEERARGKPSKATTSVHLHDGPLPPAAPALSTAHLASSAPVAALVGRAAFARAKMLPSLLPIALLLQSASAAAKAAKTALPEESGRFALAVEQLEAAIVAATESALVEGGTLQMASTALEKGALAAQALALLSPDDAAVASATTAAALREAGATLRECTNILAPAAAAATPSIAAAAVDPSSCSAEQVQAVAASLELARKAAAQAAAEQQMELLEMQNKVLMEQVAQMQKIMQQQQMSMQTFMKQFPQHANEPERRLVLDATKIMEMAPPLMSVESAMRNAFLSGALTDDFVGLYLNIVGATDTRFLAFVGRSATRPGELFSFDEMPKWAVDSATGKIPRKLASCQYVVGSGKMQCFNMKDCKRIAASADQAGGLPDDADPAEVAKAHCGRMMLEGVRKALEMAPGLLEDDQQGVVKQMVDAHELLAPTEFVNDMPTLLRLSTKIKRSLTDVAKRTLLPPYMTDLLEFFTTVYNHPNYTYVGAPVRCHGVVVGTMCGGWIGESPVPSRILERVEREAQRVSAALEREVHERMERGKLS